MKWPWQAADQKRGTLTLFDDCWVLGLPHDMRAADGQRMYDLLVEAWPNLPNVMVYPFPLDVTDTRTKR
jgi:hypothetical protein